MDFVRVTKIFSFEAAHILQNYDGLCKNIHGHSYELHVTVGGRPLNDSQSPKNGMVIDFSILKKIVNEKIVVPLDHALLVNSASPELFVKNLQQYNETTTIVPFQPTSENLIIYIAKTLSLSLPENVTLLSLRLYETATSYVEWFKEDN